MDSHSYFLHPIVVFYDPHYPQLCNEAVLRKLVPGSFQLASATDLATHLGKNCQLLISFHGAYFPKAAWRAILSFLEQGGNLAVFGGMPFARAVDEDGTFEPEQDTYTRQLYLGPFYQLDLPTEALQFAVDEDATLLQDCELHIPVGTPGTFWSYYPKLTQVSDHPEDLGSAGPLDTTLQPLIYALGTDAADTQHRVATPAALLDQRSGRFKGGRWLLSPWLPDSAQDWLSNAEAIQRLIHLTAQGATLFDVRPELGCYQPGETPALIARTRTSVALHARVTVYQARSSEILQTFKLDFPAAPVQQEQTCRLPPQQQPGLYRVVTEYRPVDGQQLALRSGFWIWDEALTRSTKQKRLTAGRDYFFQAGQPFLIYGTTYMESRVQRKFLYLPNPTRWDSDFAEMQAAGVNLVRTGIWTAWREVVPMAGMVNEAFLRALDAFILTACAYNIQVIFTFFSFSPPLFEGENPWLDPRSVEAQQDFVATLARRYAQVELLSWDLINEPSFGDPKRIFSQRPLPNHDRFEIAAFQRWLERRYTLSELQLRWRVTPADLPHWTNVLPPREGEYDTYIRNTEVRALLKVADYTHFSQDMFNQWATKMVEAVRTSGGQTLVGVGQDEAASRIAPQFYASSTLDYTTTHPWWNIDDMLWDMLLDKTPDKPNLIQEIGVMQLRDIDGRPWRDEQANGYLLERKLFSGLLARGAGLIQWLWHTNSYMTSDNENSIGLLRPDNSSKPELLAMQEFGRLVHALDGRLVEAPATPDVWVVIPYSQWFVRPDLARIATQQAVRVLGHDLGIIPQLVSEYHLRVLTTGVHQPRTIIVPGLQLIDPQAWQHLLKYVRDGGTLLVNGVLTRDAHNLPLDPGVEGLSTDLAPMPVAHYEELEGSNGQTSQVTFGDEKMSYVRKAHNKVYSISHGAGTLTWCGLPLELASDATATRALYARIITPNVEAPVQSRPYLLARQTLRDGTLILAMSESNRAQQITLDEGLTITLEPARAGALVLNTDGTTQTFGGLHC